MEEALKIVNFHEYCNKCIHKEKSGTEQPCDDCLGVPANYNSHKPIKFVEKK